MGDVGDAYRSLRANRKGKKRDNIINSTLLLEKKGVEFKTRNNGSHLVVSAKHEVIDFWPSTGQFIGRASNVKSRGVDRLLKHCEMKND